MTAAAPSSRARRAPECVCVPPSAVEAEFDKERTIYSSTGYALEELDCRVSQADFGCIWASCTP
jgi:hypothetical protein